uniref:SMODS and SLOG-associating 2TM effector domain-containing protein n=1 Tax=Clytia hemisphaerica TaxID=252671 RepID=A0A7M5WZK0_9CNID
MLHSEKEDKNLPEQSDCQKNAQAMEDQFLKNATNYIYLSDKKNRSHLIAAMRWTRFFYFLQISLIVLTSVMTVLAAVEDRLGDKLPNLVLPIIAGIATLFSSFLGVLKPQERQNAHLESANKFRVMMLRLVSCEHMDEYKEVKQEIQKELMNAPCVYQYNESKKQRKKQEEWSKRMWALNPLLKIQLYRDEKMWEDYHDKTNDKLTDDEVDKILAERKAERLKLELYKDEKLREYYQNGKLTDKEIDEILAKKKAGKIWTSELSGRPKEVQVDEKPWKDIMSKFEGKDQSTSTATPATKGGGKGIGSRSEPTGSSQGDRGKTPLVEKEKPDDITVLIHSDHQFQNGSRNSSTSPNSMEMDELARKDTSSDGESNRGEKDGLLPSSSAS